MLNINTHRMNRIYTALFALTAAVGTSAQQTPADSIAPRTVAVSVIDGGLLRQRSARNVENALVGQADGLTVIQGQGAYRQQQPTLFVRGLATLNDNAPLLLVDGVERPLSAISLIEVERVEVLKDAVATALYGYRGVNGVISVKTRRGEGEGHRINAHYEHSFDKHSELPEFVDAATFSQAYNEALSLNGQNERYSQNEIELFRSGQYAELYPNVDWISETYRPWGRTNRYGLSFDGGAKGVRYFASLDLDQQVGFVRHHDVNPYSTQDKTSRVNVRTNVDIDVSPTTLLSVGLLGALTESRTPGSGEIWSDMLYNLPALAYAVKTNGGATWGGGSQWSGTLNPVAATQAAGYTKTPARTLLTDFALHQDISPLVEGLSADIRFAYDNSADYEEDHTRTFSYGSYSPVWEDGKPVNGSFFSDGVESKLGDGTEISTYAKHFDFLVKSQWSKEISDGHKVDVGASWNYRYDNTPGVNKTYYEQVFTASAHYEWQSRLSADAAVVVAGSNKLSKDNRWSAGPSVGLGYRVLPSLSLRASAGLAHSDYVPADNYWEQSFESGGQYPLYTKYVIDDNGTKLATWKNGRLATSAKGKERSAKIDFGADFAPAEGLRATADLYVDNRKGIFVESVGKYSSVLGFTPPFEPDGHVVSRGVELGVEARKGTGEWRLSARGSVAFAKNKIKEQNEEPRPYGYMRRTGHPVGQLFGLVSDGLFADQAEIDAAPRQSFGVVRPGDVRYRDLNGDNVVDENDVCAIGHSSTAPELTFNLNIGATWKGFGVLALFQGVGRYSAQLDAKGLYRPALASTQLSKEYYDNRWVPGCTDALYPRLTTEQNVNNSRLSTLWLADRSFVKLRNAEVYYDLELATVKTRVFVRGVDLFSIDHLKTADPEALNADEPLTRSVVVGVDLTF